MGHVSISVKPNVCNKEQTEYLKKLNKEGITHTEGLSPEKVSEIKDELNSRGRMGSTCKSYSVTNPLLTCTPTQEQAIEDLHQVLEGEGRPVTQEEHDALTATLRQDYKQCQVRTKKTWEQLKSIDQPAAQRFRSVPTDEAKEAQVNGAFFPSGHWEKGLSTSPLDKVGKVQKVHLKSAKQQETATALHDLLAELRFDQLAATVHPEIYGKLTLYDYDNQLSFKELEARLAKLPEFSEREKLALLFFKYGKALSPKELQKVFGKKAGKDLIGQLVQLGILTACEKNGKTVYRLRDLSVLSHKVPNGETVYLIHDLPRAYSRIDGREPTAQVSSTSYHLLNRLTDGKHVAEDQFHGVLADFGSGVGIQAISLLKQNPDIREAIAVEIDPHAMNLSRFNAMVNGEADRFTVVNNQDALRGLVTNFGNALKRREIDIAVSNPPFNIVPSDFKDEFTTFGYGGEHGIDVAKIFWGQALGRMAEGAPFISYGYLALAEDDETFATKELRNISKLSDIPLNVTHHLITEDIAFTDRRTSPFPSETYYLKEYASMFAFFIRDHITGPDAQAWDTRQEVDEHAENIAQGLRDSGVESIAPYFSVIRTKANGKFEVNKK